VSSFNFSAAAAAKAAAFTVSSTAVANGSKHANSCRATRQSNIIF
jgi:hypothetical protein